MAVAGFAVAAEDAAVVGLAPACLCVLCGLPATGKSTLARELVGAAEQRGWRAAAVPYDDLIPEEAFRTTVAKDSVGLQEPPTEWKFHRHAVLCCIEQFLNNPHASAKLPNGCNMNKASWEKCIGPLVQPEACVSHHAPLLFLLDDNFYYPSMRYEVYQLARKYSLGFCQVHLHCDLQSCISRNESRSKSVPIQVIVEMVKRLEPPNPRKNSWERNSISLDTTEGLFKYDIQKVMELVSAALRHPQSPIEDNTKQTEADRMRCATSVLHQADQTCRRLISEAMKTAKENHAAPEEMRSLATQLNQTKATFLHDLRKQLLPEAPFAQGEDIDIERMVKRAVDIFDHQKKEILLRIMCENV